jgi:hypothetical protein
MAFLADIERRFEAAYEGAGFSRAFRHWQRECGAIERFSELESLIEFCRSGETIDFDRRDEVVAALCLRAIDGDERAALFVIWLHLPGLWGVVSQLQPGDSIDPDEFDGELLAGFWQAAKGAERTAGISSRLITRAYWRAWEACQGSKRYLARRSDCPIESHSINVGDASQAIWDLQQAGVINKTEAWLVEVVRLVGFSDEEIAGEFRTTKNAVRKRRLRAEARLVAWITKDDIPLRRNLDGRGLNQPNGGSCVGAGSSIGATEDSLIQMKGGITEVPNRGVGT